MSTKQTAARNTAETAQKRAQWEQFDFDVEAPGLVDVTNESHDKPADHQYIVSIDDVTDDAMACTGPHHVHRNAFCKHMATVENTTDDGTLAPFPSEDDDDAEPEDCDCDGLGGFPCWPCMQTGRKELPNEPPLQPFLSMTRQLTVSAIIDQRTLTESANAVTDDTPETPTALLDRARQHATNVAAEHFPDLPVETIEITPN
ncbi:hypothetical protein [Haladaptatus sp. DFWS20]|uniref:hypothetical protein n=1 Tax=Haladaptatus sp. DFWS20 TaxID=3403467 RepID=UPI003EB6C097